MKFNFLRGSDSGEYRCVGTNRGGGVEEVVTLAVVEEARDMTVVIACSGAAGNTGTGVQYLTPVDQFSSWRSL